MPKLIANLTGLLIVLCGLSSCIEFVDVEVGFTDAGTPVFKPDRQGLLRLKRSISSVKVSAESGNVEWHIQAQEFGYGVKLKEVTYGEIPEGFDQAIAPLELQPETVYGVLLSGPGWSGGREFEISHSNDT